MDGERLQTQVVAMDTDDEEKLAMEAHVPALETLHITREDGVWVQGEVSGLHVDAQRDGTTSAHRNMSNSGWKPG